MRVVFVSYLKPIDAFVLRRLDAAWPVAGVLRVVPDGTGPRAKPQPFVVKAARRLQSTWYSVYYDQLDRRLARELFPDGAPAGDAPLKGGAPVVDVPRAQLHDPATLDRLEAWAPDVIVVSGAPILRPALFEKAPVAVNLHLGMAPDYRGEHTLFWPLLRGDYDRIGATLHRIDRGVDTGAVLVRVYPELSPDDTEMTLMAKSLRMLSSALIDFVTDLSGGRATAESGSFPTVRESRYETPPGGSNIRYADRHVLHDLALTARRTLGHAPPPRPARVERLY